MNILFITHRDNFQGSSRSLMSLLEGLQELGVVPFVVNPRESLFTEALRSKGIQCAILPVPWWNSGKVIARLHNYQIRIVKSFYMNEKHV